MLSSKTVESELCGHTLGRNQLCPKNILTSSVKNMRSFINAESPTFQLNSFELSSNVQQALDQIVGCTGLLLFSNFQSAVVFPNKTPTEQQSLMLVKRLLAVAVSRQKLSRPYSAYMRAQGECKYVTRD